jgi:hypothetical protein
MAVGLKATGSADIPAGASLWRYGNPPARIAGAPGSDGSQGLTGILPRECPLLVLI